MRLVAQPAINTALLEAHAASNARWLVALLTWIGGVLERFAPLARSCPPLRAIIAAAKAKVAADLRACIRDMRVIITERAYARMRITTGRVREKLYPGAPMRRAPTRVRFYRRVTGGLFRDMHQGSLRQRAERLARILADLKPLIARTLKRLIRMWRYPRRARHARLITHDACTNRCALAAPACADTS